MPYMPFQTFVEDIHVGKTAEIAEHGAGIHGY